MATRKKEAANLERQLMIKTKTCQRLLKEVSYYEKEVKENELKLTEMKDKKADPYDVKKFEEVLGESYMMVPDSQSRLRKSVLDLSLFMENHADELDCNGEYFTTAKDILGRHLGKEKVIENNGIVETDVVETNMSDLQDGEEF